MKKLFKIGEVQVSTGLFIGLIFVIDNNYRDIDFHLVLPFISFTYTKEKEMEVKV